MSEPLPILRIDGEQARFFNELYSKCGRLEIRHAKGPVTVVFHPEKRDVAQNFSIRVQSGNNFFAVGLEQFVFTNFLNDFLEGEDFSLLPEEVRGAVLEATFEEFVDRFVQWSGQPAAIIGSGSGAPPDIADFVLGFTVSLPEKGLFSRGRLAFSRETAGWIGDLLKKEAPGVSDGRWNNIPFVAGIEFGSMELFVSQLKTLEKHDVLLIDSYGLSSGSTVALRFSPSVVVKGEFDGGFVNVTDVAEEIMSEESNVPENEPGKNGTSAPDWDSLSVRLTFELGEKVFSLAELKALQPGVSFPLETDPEKPVGIKANGRKIGFGELVRIDERIGVRILELFENANS